MQIDKVITVVDTHTAGEPTRIVTGGYPRVKGSSMAERRAFLAANHDDLRRLLMLEPRGHKDMFGAVLVEPALADADVGVIFMDADGYLRMCGHGAIGVATALVELGVVKATRPETVVTLDTPAGKIRASAAVDEHGSVQSVTFSGLASFALALGVKVPAHEIHSSLQREFRVDIAQAGNVFGLVEIDQFGLGLGDKDLSFWVSAGLRIRDHLNRTNAGGVLGADRQVELVEFAEPLRDSGKVLRSRNMVVFGKGQVDRSPCGTGTLARLAVLHAEDRLGAGQTLVHQGILGTEFSGRILETYHENDYRGVMGEVTGSAYITAFSNIVLQAGDPFASGFELKNMTGVTGSEG